MAMHPTENPDPLVKRFYLQRDIDETGVSGVGRIAEGVLWPDASVALWWHPKSDTRAGTSVAIWPNTIAMMDVHGHDKKTYIVWVDG